MAVMLAGWGGIMTLGWWLANERVARCSDTYNCTVNEMGTRDAFLVAGLLVPFVVAMTAWLLHSIKTRKAFHRQETGHSNSPFLRINDEPLIEYFMASGSIAGRYRTILIDFLERRGFRVSAALALALSIYAIYAYTNGRIWLGIWNFVVGLTAFYAAIALISLVCGGAAALGFWIAKLTDRIWLGWVFGIAGFVAASAAFLPAYAALMQASCQISDDQSDYQACMEESGAPEETREVPPKLVPVDGDPFANASPLPN